jgi:NADH-quinone oxidoreductase subunit L
MLLVVTGVGWLIHIYSTATWRTIAATTASSAYLNLFMFFMLTLVLAANLRADVRRVGRRGPVQLPADRILLPEAVGHRNAGKKAFITTASAISVSLLGILLLLFRTFAR